MNKTLTKKYKGQGFINAAFAMVVGLVIITALLPVMNSLVSEIQGSNVSNLSYSNVAFMLVGLSFLFLVLGYIISTLNSLTNPQQPTY